MRYSQKILLFGSPMEPISGVRSLQVNTSLVSSEVKYHKFDLIHFFGNFGIRCGVVLLLRGAHVRVLRTFGINLNPLVLDHKL